MKTIYICPFCGSTAITAQNAIGATRELNMAKHPPSPGDLCMCCECAELLQFDEAMDLVMPSLDSLNRLSVGQSSMIDASSAKIKSGDIKRMKPVPGNRVGAILEASLKSGVVYFIGYGVYEGDFVPPKEINPVLNTGTPSPKLVMDDGQIVWGMECWWGVESEMKEIVEHFKKVVPVDMEQARKQKHERPNKTTGKDTEPEGLSGPFDSDTSEGWRWSK